MLDELAVKTDMSKPPISVADLKLLQEDDEAGDADSLSLKELEGIREQIQKELKKKDKDTSKEKKSSPSKPAEEKKLKEHHKSSDNSKKPKSPRVEKVIKDSDSIFGNVLSSIDEKIIEEGVAGKKKERRKEDKKSSDGKKSESKKTDDRDKKKSDRSDGGKESGKSKDESKKSKDPSKKQSDSHKHKSKDREKKHSAEKKETSTDIKDSKNKTDVNKDASEVVPAESSNATVPTIEPVFRRLADKYNPKPRKSSVDVDVSKPVADAIEKNMESQAKNEPKIPFLGDTPTSERPPSPRILPKTQTLPVKADPRLKQHSQQIPFLENAVSGLPPVLNNVLQQLRGTLNVNVAGNMTPRDPFLSSPNHGQCHPENTVSVFGQNNCQSQGFGMPNNQLMPQNQVSQFNQNQPFNQQHNQFGMQNVFPNQSRNTYVNTFIVQHNSMNQNQFVPPMNSPQMNNIPINTQMNNIPINNSPSVHFNQFNQQKKLFNPYEPISTKPDEYDLSKMQPVDFYSGQAIKQPLLSPPFASTSRAILPNNNRPGDSSRPFPNRLQNNDRGASTPVHEFGDSNRPNDNRPFGNRFQNNDHVAAAAVNEFGDKDERVVQQPVVNKSREERDPRTRFRDNKKSKQFRREYNKFNSMYSKDNRSREREKESFTSPLDSLYSGNNYQKSGKGYGFQKFKIPKIKRPSPEREKSPPKDDEKESTEVAAEKKTVIKDDQKKEPEQKETKPDVQKKAKEDDAKSKVAEVEDEQKESAKEENLEDKQEENKEVKEKEVKEEVKGESKEDKSKEEENKASQSEQSLLGEFIVNLLGNTNKKDVLVQLFNTLADSLSNQQKKKFKRIQHIADSDSEQSTDEESKTKTKKEAPKEETETAEEKPETDIKEIKTDEPPVEDKPLPTTEKESESKDVVEEVKEEESEPKKVSIRTRKRGGKKGGRAAKAKKAKQEIEESKNETSDNEQQVVETVGERIKSRKRNPQAGKRKARKFRTELDMLHEDIKDMFIRDGVLTATGKRMCRILKDDPQALTSAQEPMTEEESSPVSTRKRASTRETPTNKEEIAVKETAKQEDALKRKLRSSNVCVLIEKTDLSKLVLPKSSDKESPKSASKKPVETKGKKRKADDLEIIDASDISVKRKLTTAPPKRDSLKRTAKEQTKYNEQEESDEEAKSHTMEVEEEEEEPLEEEKTVKEHKSPKKKKFRTSWSKGVIKKKARNTSKSDRSSERSTPVPPEHTPVEDVASDNDESSSEDENLEDVVDGKIIEGKDAKLVPPDKSYYLNCHNRMKVPCKLCSFNGKIIIQHYNTAHPDQEVLIARFSPATAEKVIRDAAVNNYDEIQPFDIWEIKNRRKKFNFECHFCQSIFVDNSENFYDHIATHTGEYRWACTICSFKTTTIKCLRGHAHYVHSMSLSNPKPLWPAPPNYSLLFGYICADCNFVQLNRERVQNHVKNYHNGRDEFIIKINMSAREIEENFEIEKTTAVEQPEEEVSKTNVKQEKPDNENPLHSVFIMQEIKQERDVDDESAKSKTADIELPKAVEKSLPKPVEEPVEKPKEKEAELNVFTCETDINQENQRIEEERMKKMEEVNERVKSNRTSDFVDKLKNRLETIMTTPHANPETALSGVTNNNVAETPRVHIIKRATPKVSKTVDPKSVKVDVEATFVPKSNAPIFSTIQRLQDNLTSNSELCKIPPLKSKAEIPSIAKNIKDQLLYKSMFEVRKVNGKITFCCAAPACIVTTDSKESFHNHCQYVHQKLTDVKCTICQETCDTMVDNFEHVIENHWEEILFSAGEDDQVDYEEESVENTVRPLLRMRRLSGDMLSQARDAPKEDGVKESKGPDDTIQMDENSGFPFKIASVSGQVSAVFYLILKRLLRNIQKKRFCIFKL